MLPSDTQRAALDVQLLQAHARDDRPALVTLYLAAADLVQAEDAVGFYLTHAYVFALELDDTRAPKIRARLVQMGREA